MFFCFVYRCWREISLENPIPIPILGVVIYWLLGFLHWKSPLVKNFGQKRKTTRDETKHSTFIAHNSLNFFLYSNHVSLCYSNQCFSNNSMISVLPFCLANSKGVCVLPSSINVTLLLAFASSKILTISGSFRSIANPSGVKNGFFGHGQWLGQLPCKILQLSHKKTPNAIEIHSHSESKGAFFLIKNATASFRPK